MAEPGEEPEHALVTQPVEVTIAGPGMSHTRTMTDSGSGQRNPYGPSHSGGDSGSSSQPEQANPFSREGAPGAGAWGADPGRPSTGPTASSASSASEWPGYPPSQPEPTRVDWGQNQPPGYGQPYPPPSAQSYPPPAPPEYPPYDPQSVPPYDASGGPPYPPAAPYGVSPYPSQPYGAYGYAPPNHPQAVTALVLSIVGLVICPPVGIGGLVLGARARREIDANPGQYGGRGIATAGWVLGIVGVALMAFYLIFFLIGIAASAGGG